jgi:hypothetical protein
MRGSRLLAAGARAERTPPIGPIRQKNGAAFVQISRDSLCPVGRLRLYRQQTPSGFFVEALQILVANNDPDQFSFSGRADDEGGVRSIHPR